MCWLSFFFFFNDTATTEIYTLSLHDALPIVVYMMYDTMPVDEPGWRVDPLAGTLTDVPPFCRCLVARGAFNTKGELRGFLNACETIKATRQKIPVNLILVVE